MIRVRDILKKYINEDGQVAYIRIFKGRVSKYVLEDEFHNKLTPILDGIKFDADSNTFLAMVRYKDVYPDDSKSTMEDRLYFHLDFKGNPISDAYSLFQDAYFPIEFSNPDVSGDDLWYTQFGCNIHEIGLNLGKVLDSRREKIRKLK